MRIDPKVRQSIADLEAKLLLLKGDKLAYENTKALIKAIKAKNKIKD